MCVCVRAQKEVFNPHHHLVVAFHHRHTGHSLYLQAHLVTGMLENSGRHLSPSSAVGETLWCSHGDLNLTPSLATNLQGQVRQVVYLLKALVSTPIKWGCVNFYFLRRLK